MIRLIVAGSRGFSNYALMKLYLDSYLKDKNKADLEIISGTARGADTYGSIYAEDNGIKLVEMPAEWERLGRTAGYIRNEAMAKYAAGADGVLFAFWDRRSRGTKHMIDMAKEYNLEVHIIEYGT